jgi:ribosomal protein S18 acetylase RimI-like enzyme
MSAMTSDDAAEDPRGEGAGGRSGGTGDGSADGTAGGPRVFGTEEGPRVLGAGELDAEGFAVEAHRILAELVAGGAALGWVEPPSAAEVTELAGNVFAAVRAGDGALRAAYVDGRLAGFGYWLRYARPTHRPHADLEKLAVAPWAQGHGLGRALTAALIADARAIGIEVLTLDARADNTGALALYHSLGFTDYGRLPAFVAIGPTRWDKVFCLLDLRTHPQQSVAG